MSNIGGTISNICYEIDDQNQAISNKVKRVNQVWEGEANRSFNEAHQEVLQYAKQTKRQIESMKSLVSSLESSMQAAERDKQAKAAKKRS